MVLNFDVDQARDAIMDILERTFSEGRDVAPFGAAGAKPAMRIARSSQLGLMKSAESEWILAIGFGSLGIPVAVPVDQLRVLHAQLSAMLSAPN